MSPKDRLTAFAEQIGFEVESESGVVRAVRVPCLFVGRVPGTCIIETSCEPATGKPDNRIGGDVHAVQITIDGEYDGRVYHADGTPIGNHVGGDGKTWSNISIKTGARGRPEPDETAHDLLHRYAKHIVGAVSAAGYSEPAALAIPDPFHIPNTFEARAAIAPVQDRIRGQRIAIIGLGGTGAHLLDLIAKTPVSEIHLLDSDCVDWHTLNPNPPKDTDGRREDSGRGVRELQGRWPGLHWGRWEVGGRSSVAAQGPYGRLRELRCAGWRENTQQGTLADRGGASLRGRWVSCSLAVRPGVEWLAAGPRRE